MILVRRCRTSLIYCCVPNLFTARAMSLLTRSIPYEPPAWAKAIRNAPRERLQMANVPTPLYRVLMQNEETTADNNTFLQTLKDLNIAFYIKRDDSSGGVELGGNKIRKLEFLLADALLQQCDSIITIGGEQSNHCRATAAAARMIGLEPHLILRTAKADQGDIGLVGNVLINRMVGSKIYTCTPGEYGRIGSKQLIDRLAAHLTKQGKHPYTIPVGGSNGIGTWGYIQAVEEMVQQWSQMDAKPPLDHVVFACGSGGTACGIAIGIALAFGSLNKSTTPRVHAVGVCDDPDYFYSFVAGIAEEMGLEPPRGATVEAFVRQHMTVHQGKGKGYAIATPEELEFTARFAQSTGIVLDPVYSGKAMYNFMSEIEKHPELYRHKNVLFWHTGGALGLYDKVDDLAPLLSISSPCTRLDVYGRNDGIDLSEPAEQC